MFSVHVEHPTPKPPLPALADQRRYWDERWDRQRLPNDYQRRRGDTILDLLRSLRLTNPEILDCGCGTGWFTEQLSHVGRATGLDLSEAAITYAKATYPHVPFIAANLFELSFPVEQFDVVVSQEVLAHVQDPAAYLDRIARVLKPNGFLIITSANPLVIERWTDRGPDYAAHIKLFVSRRELKRMLRQRFRVLRMTSIMPIGNRGFFRLVNSYKLNTALGWVIPPRYLERVKEWAGLGDREESGPKPLVLIGYRPILWHVMRYYAHFGHHDFILCLGYRGDVIKNYFRTYDECASSDFVFSEGGRRLELLQSDIAEWRITFVDTGINSNIGQRLKAVEPHLAGEREFFANYSDGLTDVPVPAQLEHFRRHDRIASFLCVKPQLSYHFVLSRPSGEVTSIRDIAETGLRVNGGHFIFKAEIFDYLRNGEELVPEAFQRLLAEDQLVGYRYDGFWQPMDTFKDRQRLEDLYARGDAPWEVWKRPAPAAPDALGTMQRPPRRRALRSG